MSSNVTTGYSGLGIEIIPAAACLTLLTVGSVSVYGNTTTTSIIISFFSILFCSSLFIVIGVKKS